MTKKLDKTRKGIRHKIIKDSAYYKKGFDKRVKINKKIEKLERERKKINQERHKELNNLYSSYTVEERTKTKKRELSKRWKKIDDRYDKRIKPINNKILDLKKEYRDVF